MSILKVKPTTPGQRGLQKVVTEVYIKVNHMLLCLKRNSKVWKK